MTERRSSQSDWYKNRGKVREKTPCPGSGLKALHIVDKGDWSKNPSTGRITGDLPRGQCIECGDHISVNVTTGKVRRHNDARAEYKRQILISEKTFLALYRKCTSENSDMDNTAEEFILEMLKS